ncbi:MAG TPA: 2Fe-2S iron-sulfur cluster-binding protein [Candidatus Krumholzibacteria bacterium]|nr:2Fe-2S iron-sulfur cluster-binding protein [Candidatus Krumholzibacteria bacterium]
MTDRILFTIDGQEVRGRPGQTVLEAAEEAGVWIPRLCHVEGVTPHGACRLCTCFVDGRPQSTCTFPVTEGIEVENDTPRSNELRRHVIEMLLVEGNHFCMFCEESGHCELQALAYRFGVTHARYRQLWPDRDVDATHPEIWIDRNRCVQCGRCVRVSQEIDGKNTYQFTERGLRQRVAVNAAEGLVGTDAAVDDAATHACPTGALLPKHEGYSVPIGRRRYDDAPIGSEVESLRQVSNNGEGRS